MNKENVNYISNSNLAELAQVLKKIKLFSSFAEDQANNLQKTIDRDMKIRFSDLESINDQMLTKEGQTDGTGKTMCKEQ